ncbi:hypothetical protein FCH28_09540 [Streptomyces piniterrae]|uniref:Uncharacterized protein n=1 Tax=Streptomyces piniterrae TaxID=2571125 RepID=A0A4U0NYY5_9ACTN|nr:hypothetical protein [Streptomyces piniterrae]TJZ55574.1 hypothetical protein FCH28_09540 [Streptomyces piniterrae]
MAMCVRVERVPSPALPYDSERRVISVPDCLSPQLTVIAVRAILDELAIPQPEFGAVCFCGTPIGVSEELIPPQRLTDEVIHIGA